MRSRFPVHFLPRLLHLERSGPGPCKKRCRQSRFHVKFLQAHPKLAHRSLPRVLACQTLFYPPTLHRGERGEEGRGRARRRGEGGSASGDRTFRRFCPERRCGPRSAVGGAGRERAPRPMSVRRRVKKGSQAAERRWKCEGGREGGRRKRNRGIDSSRGGGGGSDGEMRRGEERWLVRSVVVGLFPPPTDRQSSECVLRSVCLPARLQLLLSCHYSPSSRTRRPSSIVGRGGTEQREGAAMGRSRSTLRMPRQGTKK